MASSETSNGLSERSESNGLRPSVADAPSSGGLLPRIARAIVRAQTARSRCARCPLYHLGELRSPAPPLGRRFILQLHTSEEMPPSYNWASPRWWAVQDLNL